MNPQWHFKEEAQLDLRRLRPILKRVPQQYREQVVKDLREAYPLLLIDLSPDGTLRVQNQ